MLTPLILLDRAEAQVRYAEAMIDQAEAAAAEALDLIEALDRQAYHSEVDTISRVRLLDRIDLVLTSAKGRREFAAQKKERGP